MTTVAEEVATFMDEYKAADPTRRNAKREYALFELFKWESVAAEIRNIGREAV